MMTAATAGRCGRVSDAPPETIGGHAGADERPLLFAQRLAVLLQLPFGFAQHGMGAAQHDHGPKLGVKFLLPVAAGGNPLLGIEIEKYRAIAQILEPATQRLGGLAVRATVAEKDCTQRCRLLRVCRADIDIAASQDSPVMSTGAA